MKWRKWNRIIHRDFGYFFAAMTIIYSLSGIALNHIDDWNPSYKITQSSFSADIPAQKDEISKQDINKILEKAGQNDNYKKHYFPNSSLLKIFIEDGNIVVNMKNGKTNVETIKRRPVFYEVNFLHYNNPKQLWTWFSDIFAGSLILITISGLLLLKGEKGITGRGAWLTLAGLIIPVIFLLLYL